MIATAVMLLFPSMLPCCDLSEPTLTAVVVEGRIFWRGNSKIGGVLRLHSVPVEGTSKIEDHDFGFLWTNNQANQSIAWHIRDSELWALTSWIQHPHWDACYLAKAPLTNPKSDDIQISEHVIARCESLESLRNDLNTTTLPPVYFDYVPTGPAGGKLFALQSNKLITVWEYSFKAINPDAREGVPPDLKYQGKWTRADEYSVPFFEPFQVYWQGDDPFAIARSGVYSIRAARQPPGKPSFEKQVDGPIMAVIEDQRAGKVYAFTKSSSHSLDKLNVARPFEFSGVGDNRDDTAKALVRIVEFLDSK